MDNAWLAIGRLTSIIEQTHSTYIGVDYPDVMINDKLWKDELHEPISVQYQLKCRNSNTLAAKRDLMRELDLYRNFMKGEVSKWKTDYYASKKIQQVPSTSTASDDET